MIQVDGATAVKWKNNLLGLDKTGRIQLSSVCNTYMLIVLINNTHTAIPRASVAVGAAGA